MLFLIWAVALMRLSTYINWANTCCLLRNMTDLASQLYSEVDVSKNIWSGVNKKI